MTSVRRTTLGECCEIVSGATPSTSNPAFWDGHIEWATPKDLSVLEGKFITHTSRRITSEGFASCGVSMLPPRSVLFSSRAPIGHVAINAVPMATNQGFKSLVPRKNEVDASFLYHWLRAHRSQLERMGNGATFKEVSKSVISRVEIRLPPLAEQRRIADILDRAEALRAKRRESIAQLEGLTQAIFLEMFGDPVTNPKRWQSESLLEVCRAYGGGTPSKTVLENWNGSLPWFSPKDLKKQDLFDSIDHISSNVTTQSRLKLLPPNTVVIVVRGMILAHTFPVSILRVAATINQDLRALLPLKEVDPQFLAHCLRSQSGFALTKVSESAHGTKRLDARGLAQLCVLLPPKELQVQFSERVSRANSLVNSMKHSLAELDALFASLQQRAFSGAL